LQKNATFDPLKDFTPMCLVAKATMVLAISDAVPATDMKSFLAYAKAHPGSLNLRQRRRRLARPPRKRAVRQGDRLANDHVPYKGQAPTLTALMTNDVQVLLTTPTDAMRAQAAAGRIKLIGVTSDRPSPFDPKTDVVQKTVPGFVLYSWFGVLREDGDTGSRACEAA
jgi:tripartite-type tricarboxylate transporter receptor subunit TctC